MMRLPKLLQRNKQRFRRLRFEREGKYFVVIAVGIGFAAMNTGNNLLFLLLGWMLALIIASGILSELNLRKVHTRRQAPPRVTAGRPFLMEVILENRKGRAPSFAIEVEDSAGGSPLDKRCFFLKVPAGRTQSTSYRHTIVRRGLYTFDGFRISTRFPFGFFRKTRFVPAITEVLVYPATFPVTLPTSRRGHAGDLSRGQVGRHGDFFGLKEYREGDDRRDIHWRSSARHGRLLVREYEKEAYKRITLVLDNGIPDDAPASEHEAFERAVSLTASLAEAYLRHQYAVSLVARGLHVPAGVGAVQNARLLKALALLPSTSPEQPLAAAIDRSSESALITRPGYVAKVPIRADQILEAT